MTNLVHLDWARDLDGYRLERRAPSGHRGSVSSLIDRGGLFVVREGGALEKTTPLQIDGLYRQLAECRASADGALEFVNRHGFLFRPDDETEAAVLIVDAIKSIRTALAWVDRREWSRIGTWLNGAASPFSGGVGSLGVRFHFDPDAEHPSLQFSPGNLLKGIYVQMLQDAARGAKLKKCLNPSCPEWFEYGPGTAHRETALYCSPRCQKAHAYMRTKEAQQ